MTTQSWWGQRFLEILQTFTNPTRLGRGFRYANRKRIEQFLIEDNLVIGKIRGNASPYYGVYTPPLHTTTIEFDTYSRSRWQFAIDEMTSKASLVSKLMLKDMPNDLEAICNKYKINLLPQSREEITTTCSCPDWENPCKHVAGLYYFLANQLDEDPFLLLELRGLSKAALYEELEKSPLGSALVADLKQTLPEPTSAASYHTRPIAKKVPKTKTLQDFWLSPKPVPTAEPPIQTAVSAIHIKKQGDNPAFWQRENSFIETMTDLYGRVKKFHQDKTI